jgi:DNA-binding FadR family transcriptional regulator
MMEELYGINAISRESVTDIAIEQLKRYIIDNKLTTGDKLPSETQLSQVLGISRPSIREAMMSLEGLGIIQSKQGKGRFIQDFNYVQMIETLSYNIKVHFNDFMEVVHVRHALEECFLPKAAALYTQEDWDELEAMLEEMRISCMEGAAEKDMVGLHTRFHRRLYKVIGNKLLDSLIDLFSTFQKYLTDMNSSQAAEPMKLYIKHRELLDAARSADRNRICECFDSHFSDFERDDWSL